ncbi:MAG: glycosyltransferase [Chloroflexota bacterium]
MSIKRVAFISFHACPLAAPGEGKSGGMNVYVRQLALALGSLGVRVDIFTRNHPKPDADQIEPISPMARVVHLPGGEPDTPMPGLFGNLPGFLEGVRGFQEENGLSYDLVHSHYWLSGWVGRALASWQAVPHVVTFHTLALIKLQARAGEVEPADRKRVERELLASADRVIAFTPHEKDAMVRLYAADPSRITLAPCGVDLSLFRPLDQRQARDRLGLNGGKVLLYVGRLEPLKGLELLLQTAAQLETCHQVRMVVVGGGGAGDEEVERMRRLARSLRVEELFDFVGRVDQGELPFYYNAADVCVVPSYYESFGLAALESMACGTPVVATRVGGLSTIVQHGRTGYLKSWRCPEAFANSLEMIMSSTRLQHSMGLAARKRAEGMGWDKVAARLHRVYESLTGKERAADND